MSRWPTCTCGCGQPVAVNEWTKKPRPYAETACRYRVYRERMKQDPERHVRYLEKQRGYCRKHREKVRGNAELKERVRAQQRVNNRKRYWRMRADPEQWNRHLETQRMRYRERQNRRGVKPKMGFVEKRLQMEQMQRLPAAPLAAWIASRVGRFEALSGVVCAELGVTEKSFYEWNTGRRQEVQFDIVDRILTNADVLWWDVYDPDEWPEEYEKARAVFEPEDLAA